MKKIYIAHPLMGPGSPEMEWGDIDRNVSRYLRFVAHACDLGHTVISWVHHYMMHSRGLTDGDALYYLTRDRELLKDADELWVCGPPEMSAGVRYEIKCAEEFEITVIMKTEWMHFDYTPWLESETVANGPT